MEDRILQLIRALRVSGVRISLAESSEAFLAVEMMGITDQKEFQLALRSTLIKNSRDLRIFDKFFPLFFGSAVFNSQAGNPLASLKPSDARMAEEGIRGLAERLRGNFERLLGGKPFLQEELERVAKLIGLLNISDLDYQQSISHKMARALSVPEMREAIKQLLTYLQKNNLEQEKIDQLRTVLQDRLNDLENQLLHFSGNLIVQNLSYQESRGIGGGLYDRPFSTLSETEKRTLSIEVKRLVLSLRTKIALRQKRTKTGQFDVKTTIRRNLKYQGIPMKIHHYDKSKKPKLIVICDVSTSMRFCSELMLSFIYALQEQVQKSNIFAFIDHLEYISDEFVGRDGIAAVSSILRKMPAGSYNTNLGASLDMFSHKYLSFLDNRTTLIIVGDGRNNYHDPRLDLFSILARRSSRTIWLNPEPEYLCGTGDSDMPVYTALCSMVLKVGTVAELVKAVDHLMTT